jgi:hypothetical protein
MTLRSKVVSRGVCLGLTRVYAILFKLYRLTRSTREVLARLRPKFVLSKSPLAFLWPRDRTSTERAKSFSLFVFFVVVVFLCLVASPSAVFLGLMV